MRKDARCQLWIIAALSQPNQHKCFPNYQNTKISDFSEFLIRLAFIDIAPQTFISTWCGVAAPHSGLFLIPVQ